MGKVWAIWVMLFIPILAVSQEKQAISTKKIYTTKKGYIITRGEKGQREDEVVLLHMPKLFFSEVTKVVGDTLFQYKPEEVVAFGFGPEEKYLSRKVELEGKTQWVFLKLDYDGQRYRLLKHGQGNDKRFFLEFKHQEFLEGGIELIDPLEPNKSLEAILPTCSVEEMKPLNAIKYSGPSILSYLKRLERCLNAEKKANARWHLTRTPIKFEVVLGGSHSVSRVSYNAGNIVTQRNLGDENWLFNYPFESVSNQSFQLGVNIPLSMSLSIRPEFTFRSVGSFNARKSGGSTIPRVGFVPIAHEMSLSYTAVGIPLMLRYHFSNLSGLKIVPFVEVGGIYQRILALEGYSRSVELPISGSFGNPYIAVKVSTFPLEEFFPKNQFYGAGGLGLRINVTSSIWIETGLRHSQLWNPDLLQASSTQYFVSLALQRQ